MTKQADDHASNSVVMSIGVPSVHKRKPSQAVATMVNAANTHRLG